MEVIIAICGILGGIAAVYGILTYFKTNVEKPNEQRTTLIAQFKANQKLAREIRDRLIECVERHNAYKEELFKGVTFEAYISLITKTLETDLADETLNKVIGVKLPESIFNSMTASLDTQFQNLSNVKNYLHLYLHNDK